MVHMMLSLKMIQRLRQSHQFRRLDHGATCFNVLMSTSITIIAFVGRICWSSLRHMTNTDLFKHTTQL